MTDRYPLLTVGLLLLIIQFPFCIPTNHSSKDALANKKMETKNASLLQHMLENSLNETEFKEVLGNRTEAKRGGMHVINLQYNYVQNPLLITIFLMAICILKIVYESWHRVNETIPESCLLMLLGLGIGFLLLEKNAKSELAFLRFSAQSFFLFLLPPIVLQSAYSLKDRAFAENLGTILLYAVLGTILNVAIVGPALYGFYRLGIMGTAWQVTFLECILFSTIVAAVDPVAVLGIFQNMGVNKLLYFLVFGESLFNDGVTVVLYDTIIEFMEIDTIGPKEFALGTSAFLCVCLGAMTIGIVMGFLSAFMTKYTDKIHIVEPFLLYGCAYLSYLLAELCDFSGIISIICCGLIQAHYAFENISPKSIISVQHLSKLLSSLGESLIFIILSVMAVNVRKAWADFNIGFAVLAVVLCIVARFMVTYGLAFCVNRLLLGIRKIGKRDQFVMAYGGLRGAITFSLVFSLNPELLLDKEKTQNVLLTSAYVVIFFTTFLQGITMKPLVRVLQVKLHEEDSLFNEINTTVMEHTMSSIERIMGTRGNNYLSAIAKRLSRRFLRPLVNKNPQKKYSSVVAAYQHARLQSVTSEDDASDVSASSPTHWEMDMFCNTHVPNPINAATLDLQDAYRRRRSIARGDSDTSGYNGTNGVSNVHIGAVRPKAQRTVTFQTDMGARFFPITDVVNSTTSLANIFLEGQSKNMAAREAPMFKPYEYDRQNPIKRARKRQRTSSAVNMAAEGEERKSSQTRVLQNALNGGVENGAFAESENYVTHL